MNVGLSDICSHSKEYSERDLSNIMRKMTIVFIVLIILTACNSTNEPQGGKIKVLYWNQEMFNADYGNMFYSKYPDIEVEVVSLDNLVNRSEGSIDELIKQIDQANIDVVFTRSYEEYLTFSNREVLEGLDEWIQKDHFDIDNFNPHIISLLRENTSNRLNGLAPMFSSIALFYNKDMFDQFSIEYPEDQLSWKDVFGLATRFVDDKDDTYGFSFKGSLYELVSMIGRTNGLNIVTVNNNNIWIMNDSEEWENILATVQEVHQSGAIHITEPVFTATLDVKEKEELFINGKSAMTISTPSLIEQYEKSDKSFTLGIVTVPVDPAFRDSSYTIRPNQVFGIYSKSPNKELAWKFISFVNSDEVAKVKSKSVTGLYTRTTYSEELFGHSLEPFYKLNHDIRICYPIDLPRGFNRALNELVTKEATQFLSGSQNSHETVIKIKQEGEVLYKNMKE